MIRPGSRSRKTWPGFELPLLSRTRWSADLARVAEEHGIVFVYMPVDAATLTRAEAEKFMQTCEALKRPLLVCGRSGGYATRIWEKAESLWLEPPDSG